MEHGDTTVGEFLREFPATTQGFREGLRSRSVMHFRVAVETLCARYWRPVFGFLRCSLRLSREDAKDLSQAFFLWLIEGDALRRYEPDRASFRRYLKILLRSFARDKAIEGGRLKRGGGRNVLPLEGEDAGGGDLIPDPGSVSPEDAFERVWRTEVVHRALRAVKSGCRALGQDVTYRVFEMYDLVAESKRPTYVELASRLGLPEEEVKNRLVRMREALRLEIRAELAGMTGDERDLEDEWNALFGA